MSGKSSSGSQFSLGDQDQFSYDGYDRFYANEVKAALLTDQKILELLLPRAKRQQVIDDVITAVVGSPVDPLFIDAQGRKSGFANGAIVNEIPGAKVDRFDEKTVLILPNGKGYSFQAKGFTEVNGGETMTLAYQVPGGGNSILEVSFLDVAIAASETYTTEIGSSSDSVPPLVLPDGTFSTA